ncbi:hypothetical protein QQX98_003234 [Neonectria punicea]|uniref:F-box domain-containing protein n=1 Tax=Neonectria punicea TaxID=979145 RepID=A0ABR1HFV4_9HYPO
MPSFLDLPLENVIEMLCRHCTLRDAGRHDGLYAREHRPAYDKADLVALARLCLMSKTLNAIATPRLYHRPATRRSDLLARTLIERPDLASHVRCFADHEWCIQDRGDTPPQLLALHDERARGLLADERDDGWAWLRSEIEEKTVSETLITAVLVSLCPNLEDIYAVSHYRPVCILSQPNSLLRLKMLVTYHGDTKSGMPFGHLKALSTAAPNLKTIICHELAEQGGSPRAPFVFDHVTGLCLVNSVLNAESLAAVLVACPRLETFAYIGGNSKVASYSLTGNEAQRVILQYAPTLKNLHIDLHQIFSASVELAEPDMIHSLADMERLEHLTLDSRCLLTHTNPFTSRFRIRPGPVGEPILGGPFLDPEDTRLVTMLPPSLRSLRLQKGAKGPDLRRLIDCVKVMANNGPQSFPNLENVQLLNLGNTDTSAIEETFRGNGVAFSSIRLRLVHG